LYKTNIIYIILKDKGGNGEMNVSKVAT